MIIRSYRDDDWPAVAAIALPVVAAGETYCWPPDASPEQTRAWWTGDPDTTVYVAVDADGSIVATAQLHPNRPGGGAHVANASFMVAPWAGGRGIGRAIAEHVLQAAVEQGYRAMQFNAVVETNTVAVRLWRSLGFTVLTTVPEAFRHPTAGLVGLHVMHRAL